MEKYIKINNLDTKIYLPNKTPKEVVVGVHGFSGDKESSVLIALAKELNKNNIALVTYDLPCHGKNDNSKPLNLKECIDSIGNAIDYAKSTYANLPISIFATSFGGYLTLVYLSKHHEKINKLILRAPAIYMSKVLEENILPFNGFSADKIENPINLGYEQSLYIDKYFINDLRKLDLEQLPQINNFIYILQGKKDNIVNPNDNENFFNKFYKNNHKFYYFKNADHRFKHPGELERIIEITTDVLKK